MDDIVCLAPTHFEKVLGCFGGDRTQATDKDDMFGFELWE